MKPYEELVSAFGNSSNDKKPTPLASEEKSELDHYLEIEHLMRLAKARARQLLAHGQ